MLIVNIIIAAIIAGLGSLVRSCPDLMSGYNTMTKEQKKNFDVEGASRFLQKVMTITAIAMLLGTLTSRAFHIVYGMELSIALPVFIMVIYLTLATSKFDHNPQTQGNTIVKYVVTGMVLIIFGGITLMITLELQEEDVQVDRYGVLIPYNRADAIIFNNIQSIDLKDSLFNIGIKTNGFGFGNVSKGYFNVDKFKNSLLYLYDTEAPYIEIISKTGKHYYINYKDKAKTKRLFEKLKNNFENNSL